MAVKPKIDIERLRFDLDIRKLTELAVLGIGAYGAGKTYLMADFLSVQREDGEIAYIDMAGEKGSLSAANSSMNSSNCFATCASGPVYLLKFSSLILAFHLTGC